MLDCKFSANLMIVITLLIMCIRKMFHKIRFGMPLGLQYTFMSDSQEDVFGVDLLICSLLGHCKVFEIDVSSFSSYFQINA